jgi:hypothetical protein
MFLAVSFRRSRSIRVRLNADAQGRAEEQE